MFVIEDLTIYATRGDIVFFFVTAEDNGIKYKFQPGDVVRFSVYGKKDAENTVLQKDFPVTEVTESVYIYLDESDTRIGETISKHKDYWYEVVLNPDTNPQTIIGYDEDGAKVFRLFPEAEELDEYTPDPEDFPVVDEKLDMTSPRPVANSAVASAIANMMDVCERTNAAVAENFVTPQMYGAIGDGVADDTEAIQEALRKHRNVYIPEGVYMIRTSTDDTAEYNDGEGIGVEIPSNTRLILHPSAVLKGIPNKSSRYRVLWAKDSENIFISGGRIECDKESASGSHGFGLLFRHCKDVTVENMTIYNALADCINIGCYADAMATGSECENMTVRNCELYGSRRQGITLSGVDGCLIEGCHIHDVSGLNPQSGIDIEVNNHDEQGNTNIKIASCRFENNGLYDVIVSNGMSTDTVEITNCVSRGAITNFNNLVVLSSDLNLMRGGRGNTRVIGCNIVRAESYVNHAYFTNCIIQETHIGENGSMTVEHSTFISEGLERVCYCYEGMMNMNNCTLKAKNCVYVLQGKKFVVNDCVFDVVTDGTFYRMAYVDDGTFNGCTISIDTADKEAFSPRNSDGIVKVIGCKFLTGFYANVASGTTNRYYVGNIFCVAPSGQFNNAAIVHDNINAY